MSDDIMNVLVVVAFAGAAVYTIHGNRKRKRMLAACAERLDIEDFEATASSMTGKVRGLPLDVTFHAGSKNTPPSTTVEVGCDPCAVFLDLRKQDADELRSVKEGRTVDLTIGDAAFDARWIVEGAPAARVQRLLQSGDLRARLMAFASLADAHLIIDGGKVTVRKRESDVGPDAVATERIELALAVAEAVIAEAETPLPPGEVDPARTGYRTSGRADPDADGAAEVSRLKIVRATRNIAQLRTGVVAAAIGLSSMLVFLGVLAQGGMSAALPVVIFSLGTTLWFVSSYRAQLREAPGTPGDKVIVRSLIAWWCWNVAVVLYVYLHG